MSDYRYTPARPAGTFSPRQDLLYDERALSPHVNGYMDEVSTSQNQDQSEMSNGMFYDPKSPFFGMDPQLAGFVQKYNVVMDDGAVVNVKAMQDKAALEGKTKTKFQPPCGLTRSQFILLCVLLTVFVIVVIASLTFGLIFGLRIRRPEYPRAQPWWRRSQMYQLNVATWANDVGGPIGRLADVIPRMGYLSVQIGATSIVLTDMLASDVNGVLDWTLVNSQVAAPDDAVQTLFPQLIQASKQPLGSLDRGEPIHIVLGMPLYATSDRHEWFQQSQLAAMSRFSGFYLWTVTPPATAQENRFYAFNNIRKAYYRHVHGNPNSPLLNLTNPEVQTAMRNAIEQWKRQLNIEGVMITNSTNVLPELMPDVRTILDYPTDPNFIWFADNPVIDAALNTIGKVCFFRLEIKRRVPTRADDLTAQLVKAFSEARPNDCSPIWRVEQLSEDNKDYLTIQEIAHFLPGSFLMTAGQEVDLSSGLTELLQWSFQSPNNFRTVWPRNVNLPNTGLDRLKEWQAYWIAASSVSLLSTSINIGRPMVIKPTLSENVFSIYRVHQDTRDRIYFVVSFQTLNRIVQFSTIFTGLNSPTVEVSFDSEHVYRGRRVFGATNMVNNQVLLLHYY